MRQLSLILALVVSVSSSFSAINVQVNSASDRTLTGNLLTGGWTVQASALWDADNDENFAYIDNGQFIVSDGKAFNLGADVTFTLGTNTAANLRGSLGLDSSGDAAFKSLSIAGTGGTGFVNLAVQSPVPNNPASGLSIFTDGSTLSWIFQTGAARSIAITGGKTLTVQQNVALSSDGTGTRTLNIGAGGTLGSAAFTSSTAYATPSDIAALAANPASNASFSTSVWSRNLGPLEASTNPIGQTVVATRANCGNQGNGLSNGTDTSETATIRHYITTDCSGVRLVYSNTGSNITPATVPNPITVRAGVLEPDGTTITPVFFGGKRSVVIDAGGMVISDPLPNTYKKGDSIWSRTYVLVNSGEKWYRGFGNYGDLTGQGVAAGVDYSTSGTISTSTSYMYVPFMIVGTPTAPTPCIALVGDSIMLSTIQTPAFYSFAMTALGSDWGKNYSYVQIALGSDTAQDFAGTIADFQTKLPFTAGCTSSWVNYGVNDFFAKSRTTTQVQADSLKIWTRFAVRGIAVWQTTITPETTSTDSWATTGNQTTVSTSANTYRINYNNWLRAGAPIDPTTKAAVAIGTSGALLAGSAGHPLTGYFEIADIVESARDSGIWKANYTPDGIHPNRTATNAMSAGCDPTIAK